MAEIGKLIFLEERCWPQTFLDREGKLQKRSAFQFLPFIAFEPKPYYFRTKNREKMTTLVPVSLERLKELEDLEARLDSLLASAREEAVAAYKFYRDRVSRDTKANAKKQLEKYHANKEEINARRRAAYKAKKEAATSTL